MASELPGWKDRALFTPGPLTTSLSVKLAMLRDLGSRDSEFLDIVRDIRRRLVRLAGANEGAFTAIPMQGSGTFGIEATLGSAIPPAGRLLALVNGAYGERIAHIARRLRIDVTELAAPEDAPIDPAQVADHLAADPAITTVALVHCETTTGLINPLNDIGIVTRRAGRTFVVDAMSSFGAVEIGIEIAGASYLVSSSNKCIEGVPGFSFILARKSHLEASAGWARGVALDLYDQWRGLERNGQFRFTPPTHAILAFRQALVELEEEGGVAGRAERYRANHRALLADMRAMGFREYLAPAQQGFIITTFRYPEHLNFHFDDFYRRLADQGHVIYPGKLTRAECFRIGTIGRLGVSDVRALTDAIRRTLVEMKIPVPIPGATE